MKITCIIVEDEPLALKRTQSYVQKTPELKLLKCFENALKALEYLKGNEVELIFLDIRMDEMTGLEFIDAVNFKGQIIFTTAYQEYAVKGYELNILDYLLKPFSYSRFLQAINKFQKEDRATKDYFFVKSGYQLEKIVFHDILLIEGMGDYRRIHCVNKKIMSLLTFSELQRLLPHANFVRVHKSYLVSIDKIDSIERNVIRINAVNIPISATYKNDFYRIISLNKD